MHGSAMSSAEQGSRREPLYVFELPVRIWHWVHAISIAVLVVTGYLIANPLSSVEGEASRYHRLTQLLGYVGEASLTATKQAV